MELEAKTYLVVERPVYLHNTQYVVRVNYVLHVAGDVIPSATYATKASLNREIKHLRAKGFKRAN